MPLDGSVLDLAIQSGWHSIRPWTPQLCLLVREITSVSATFVLAADINREIDSSLASLGLNAAEEDDSTDQPTNRPAEDASTSRKRQSILADALAKGLQVNVNGVNWQRVLIRIDEKVDEAVIIVYGLMPGRQYDIDLALAGQAPSLRRQVNTVDEHSDPDNHFESHTDPDSPSCDQSTSSSSDPSQSLSTPSTSPSQTIPSTPPTTSVVPQITLEERLNQLHHNLSLINAERESLLASLKSVRKEAQKADAALRSEMEALKRTLEKNVSGEHRAKQKVLALQEAVKRAQAATREAEELVKEVDAELPALLKKKAAKEEEYAKIKNEADHVRKERDYEEEKERKMQEVMKAELATLTHKLERLNGKKEKQETTTIPDLVEQLKEYEREIELEEQRLVQSQDFDDLHRLYNVANGNGYVEHQTQLAHPFEQTPYVPVQRPRHQSLSGPGPISRPSPIQRPTFNTENGSSGNPSPSTASFSPHQQSIWSPQRPVQQHTHAGRSNSLQHYQQQPQPTTILQSNPQRRGSLKSSSTTPSSISNSPNNTSPSPSSSPIASITSNTSLSASATSNSALSSRAPAFEPGRGLRITTNLSGNGFAAATTGFSVSPGPTPMPIQRSTVGSASISGRRNSIREWGTHGHGS